MRCGSVPSPTYGTICLAGGSALCCADDRQPNYLPARGRGYPLDRMRVLQGHRVGAVQDAARENTNAQRHDTRPARRQDERDSNCRYALLLGVFTSVDGSAKSPRSVASYVRGAVALVGRDRDSRSSTLISTTSRVTRPSLTGPRTRARDRVSARKYPLGVSNETPTGHRRSAIR